jgi:hypothetical protein
VFFSGVTTSPSRRHTHRALDCGSGGVTVAWGGCTFMLASERSLQAQGSQPAHHGHITGTDKSPQCHRDRSIVLRSHVDFAGVMCEV